MEGTQSPANSRKRAREHETESQRIKREKAAERQRRKRERDRANAQAQNERQQQQQAQEQAHREQQQQQQLLQQQQQQQQQQEEQERQEQEAAAAAAAAQQQQQQQQQHPQPPPQPHPFSPPPPGTVTAILVNAGPMGMVYAPHLPDGRLAGAPGAIAHYAMPHQLVHAPTMPHMPHQIAAYPPPPPPEHLTPQQIEQQQIEAHQALELEQAKAEAAAVRAQYPEGRPLTKEEEDRRDKVRLAARERQRKHRAMVKERKMREMGVDVGSEVPVVDESMRYPPPAEYIPHDMQHSIPLMEPPFPGIAQGVGGQTFASTLLLSFSCAPLLKAHLLRTLHMTNEELASLEPIIAEAWDRWNSQRSIHFAEAQRQAHAQSQAQAAQQQQQQPQQPPPSTQFAVEPSQPLLLPTSTPPQPPTQPHQQQTHIHAHPATTTVSPTATTSAPAPPTQQPSSSSAQTTPSTSPQTQPAVPAPTPVQGPPPPTFAHANGPDLNSLDFRNRFSRQLTRAAPSFSPAAFPSTAEATGTPGANGNAATGATGVMEGVEANGAAANRKT